jgi:hypothetical protein
MAVENKTVVFTVKIHPLTLTLSPHRVERG